MRLVLISDTHCQHRRVQVPDGDVLIHAGDFLLSGGPEELPILKDFNSWLGELPHKTKLVTPGNHDRLLYLIPNTARIFTNAKILIDEAVEISGFLFYLSPWTPNFPEGNAYWKFVKERQDLQEVWKRIPDETDVLVTHGPPQGTLDKTPEGHAGCWFLDKEVFGRVRPKVHVFGHIHEAYGKGGSEFEGATKFFNASQVDAAYRLVNKPWVVDL